MCKIYELMPTNGRKSFYGKAIIKQFADGSEVLKSVQYRYFEKDRRRCFYSFVEWMECNNRHAHKIILRYEQKGVYVVADGRIIEKVFNR